MSDSKNNKNQKSIYVKSAQSRYITLDEDCKINLSIYELSVYTTLLFEANYSTRFSEIKMSIKFISERSKMGERKVYECLNGLEFIHFVLKRINLETCRLGKENKFLIARDYMFFYHYDNLFNTPAPKDMGVQNLHTPAPHAGGTAPHAGVYIKNNNSFNNKKTTTTSDFESQDFDENPKIETPKASSSSFFSGQMQKTILSKKLTVDARTQEEFLNHCQIHIVSQKNEYSRKQRERGLLKILDEQQQNGIFEADGYEKSKIIKPKSPYTAKQEELIRRIQTACKCPASMLEERLNSFFPIEEEKQEAIELFAEINKK